MKRVCAVLCWVFVRFLPAAVVPAAEIDLQCVTQFSLGAPLGQLRVVPMVLFDGEGRRVWSDLDKGHMDMGWVARLGKDGRGTAMAIRIGGKTAGPQGFHRTGVEEFVYDAFSGQPRKLGFPVFGSLPVDLNGDGKHELVLGLASREGSVPEVQGGVLVKVPGRVVLGSKILDRPGEQVVSYTPEGTVRIWTDASARDSEAAQRRYRHRFYQANQRLTATGANEINLGGL